MPLNDKQQDELINDSEEKALLITLAFYAGLFTLVEEWIDKGKTVEEIKELLEENKNKNIKDKLAVGVSTGLQMSFLTGIVDILSNNNEIKYYEYITMRDERVRPTHRDMDGRIYKVNDPIWNTWFPPNGFNCRCKIKGLTTTQAISKGITTSKPLYLPDAGYAFNPTKKPWRLDEKNYPKGIYKAVLKFKKKLNIT